MILGLALTSHTFMLLSPIQQTAGAAVSGRYFDNIVIVAMENQNYADVMGDGHGTSVAPYIASLLVQGATVPNYHGAYSGCSEACYVALISGDTYGTSNGARDVGDINTRTLANLFEGAGLTWHAYCESSCGRDGDHFPWIDFVSITSSSERMSHVDTSASTSNLVNAVGSYNFLWYTPEDSNNMHDNDVSSGDSYLSGFIPDILSKPGFTNGRSLLMLWWDEYDPAPFLMLGPTVLHGFISSRNDVEHYTITKLLEENWGTSSLTSNDASQASMSEFFGSSPTPPGQSTNPPADQPSWLPTQVSDLWLILVGVILGGTAGVVIFGTRSRARNRSKVSTISDPQSDTTSAAFPGKPTARRPRTRARRAVSKGKLAVLLLYATLLIGGALATPMVTQRANAAASASFTFTATGDYGDDSQGNTAFDVVQKLAQVNPSFHIALGDLRYGSLDAQSWCQNFKSIYNNIVIITGNHDSGESDPGPMSTYVTTCPFSVLGVTLIPGPHLGTSDTGPATAYGYDYAFDYPAVAPIARFILVDSSIGWSCCGLSGSYDYSAGSLEYAWVSARIDEAKAAGEWVVVAGHKNCLNVGTHHNSCESSADLENLLVSKKVDLYLTAHEHNYERSNPITSCDSSGLSCQATTSFTRGSGTVIMIIGTGGAGNYGCSGTDSVVPVCMDSDYGFAKFTFSSSEFSESYVSATGSFTDSFTIGGTPPPPPPPAVLTVDFTFSPTNPSVGDAVTFTGRVTGGTSPYQYTWSFGDGNTSTGATIYHSYPALGSYIVTLTVTDNVRATATSYPQTVTVVAPTVLRADIAYSPPSPFVGQILTFSGTAAGGNPPYNFAWDFGDSSSTTGVPIQHSYSSSGTFTVVLTVTDGANNRAIATTSVDVSPQPQEITTAFVFTNPNFNDVSNAITWEVWDGGNLVSTAGQASLDPLKSYELRIFYQGHLITSGDFTAQPTIQKTIFMYRHHSATDGYIVFNSTIGSFTIQEESNSRLRFNADGSQGPYTLIINVPKGPAAVLKDGSDYPYTYDSGENVAMVETASLSSWELDFVSSTQPPPICPICPPIPSTVISNLWLVVVGGMIGLTTSLAVLTHRAHAKLQRARRLYVSRAS